MTVAVDSDVKNQDKQNQENKDTPHTRMTYNVKTETQMHRSDCAYLQAYQSLNLPANTLYIQRACKECTDQELIQPSTTPDPGHNMTNHKTHENTTNKRPDDPMPADDHKAARNRQDGIINTNIKHK